MFILKTGEIKFTQGNEIIKLHSFQIEEQLRSFKDSSSVTVSIWIKLEETPAPQDSNDYIFRYNDMSNANVRLLNLCYNDF